MSAIDPVQVLRERVKKLDGVLEDYVKYFEELKRERTALMVALAALEERKAGK